jgi:hypothetical protein
VRKAAILLVASVALVIVLGAWANSWEGSVAKAKKLATAAPTVKPKAVVFKGGPLPSKVVALLTDEANGTVAVVAAITNPDKKLPATGITVGVELLGKSGKTAGTNTAAGTNPVLNQIASIAPGETALYVNDTIIPDSAPVSATVKATGTPKKGKLQEFKIEGAKVQHGAFGVSIAGTVVNPGTSPQTSVHIEAVVKQGEKIVGAGGALVDRIDPGGKAEFQIFVIGKSEGDLVVWAPAQ